MNTRTRPALICILIVLVTLCACGKATELPPTATPVPPTPVPPTPTPYDSQASPDDQAMLTFFREGGIWTFVASPSDAAEMKIVVMALGSELDTVTNIKLGEISSRSTSTQATKGMLLISNFYFVTDTTVRDDFFRLYAAGMDQGEMEAFVITTEPMGAGRVVPLEERVALASAEFLELVIK